MSQSSEVTGTMDFKVVGTFLLLGGVGGLIGGLIGARLPQRRLRRIFAVFLMIAGVAILVIEGSSMLAATSENEQAASTSDAA